MKNEVETTNFVFSNMDLQDNWLLKEIFIVEKSKENKLIKIEKRILEYW